MSTIFSKPSGYAIRALIHLTLSKQEELVLASTIAAEESIPVPFLGKIMTKLSQAGMIASTRGPKGGYKLIRDPGEITMQDIHDLFETQSSSRECLLGHDACPGPKYCALHKRWLETQKHIDRFLTSTTLAMIAREEKIRRAK